MNRLLRLETFLTGRKHTIYTIRFLDENGIPDALSETEKFFNGIKISHPEDYQMFKALLKNIIDISGARIRFFRDESNSDCNFLRALTREDKSGKKYRGECRLYCLRYAEDRLIFGNGGIKKTRTFNVDPKLNKIAKALQKLDPLLFELEKEGNLNWNGSLLEFDNEHIFEIDL